jgi:hypothetical protein
MARLKIAREQLFQLRARLNVIVERAVRGDGCSATCAERMRRALAQWERDVSAGGSTGRRERALLEPTEEGAYSGPE